MRICQCGHAANLHFGSMSYENGEINFDSVYTRIDHCGEGHNYFDLGSGCKCGKFKVDNLKFLEEKYNESNNCRK